MGHIGPELRRIAAAAGWMAGGTFLVMGLLFALYLPRARFSHLSEEVALNLRDYTFLGTTRSLCPTCRRLVDAKIIARRNRVYLRKSCPEHGLVVTKAKELLQLARAQGYPRSELIELLKSLR